MKMIDYLDHIDLEFNRTCKNRVMFMNRITDDITQHLRHQLDGYFIRSVYWYTDSKPYRVT